MLCITALTENLRQYRPMIQLSAATQEGRLVWLLRLWGSGQDAMALVNAITQSPELNVMCYQDCDALSPTLRLVLSKMETQEIVHTTFIGLFEALGSEGLRALTEIPEEHWKDVLSRIDPLHPI